MLGGLFEDTVSLIKKWEPKQKYAKELGYRDDLLDFLRKKLNEPSPLAISPQERISVVKEDSRGLCDIGINRKVGIELKKGIKTKSQVNRLMGQLVDYMKDYEDLIVVLVGDVSDDALEKIKDGIESIKRKGLSMGLQQEPRIKLIDKSFRALRKKKKKEPSMWSDFSSI